MRFDGQKVVTMSIKLETDFIPLPQSKEAFWRDTEGIRFDLREMACVGKGIEIDSIEGTHIRESSTGFMTAL